MATFDGLVDFVDFTLAFRAVERDLVIKNKDGFENDAEHTCQLALVAWYLNETHSLGLSTEKLLRIALAHDLVEVYAGDVSVYNNDAISARDKQIAEAEALASIETRFPHVSGVHEAIEEYKAQASDEAKCIKSLDKIAPGISIYLDQGRYWKTHAVTLERMKRVVTPKAITYEPVAHLWHELLARLEAEHDRYFRASKDELTEK
ncbi:HD domain-containing protein [Patescibacteria group bacterium]|jgi:putative hydrolase of HD superfamily|nr:HD domain-containing protein [Patescibacteria group bacterium]